MTDERERNGNEWRVRDLERRLTEVEQKGSPATRILQVQVDALKERITALEQELSWAKRTVIAVTLTGVVAVFIWLIQTGGPAT